jgi:S-adenosylmethionine:tRNA-ribosyltransferase-isomerase (queuine synthetase)
MIQKVFPARIFGTKKTGGKVEVLLLEDCVFLVGIGWGEN